MARNDENVEIYHSELDASSVVHVSSVGAWEEVGWKVKKDVSEDPESSGEPHPDSVQSVPGGSTVTPSGPSAFPRKQVEKVPEKP